MALRSQITYENEAFPEQQRQITQHVLLLSNGICSQLKNQFIRAIADINTLEDALQINTCSY